MAMPTHSAPKFIQVQVRCDSSVGARSAFQSCELCGPWSPEDVPEALLSLLIAADASVS